MRRVFALIVGVVAVSSAAMTWPLAWDLFRESSEVFRLTALEVRGLRLLDGEDILEASGVVVGENIFDVDLDTLAARLDELVWVKRAHIERKPPDRLLITVVERKRCAWVQVGNRVFGVDAEGILLPEHRLEGESREELDLPLIRRAGQLVSSDAAAEAAPGQVLADSALTSVLKWWTQAVASQTAFCRNLSEIRPLGDSAVSLLLVGDGLEVRVPMDRVKERLGVLVELMGRMYLECPDPSYVDLRFDNQVFVGSATTSGKESG